ncbi:MAG: zinc ribbon domain-containing protein [Caldilineales bacterium]
MPIYEYVCAACTATFSHYWRSIKAAEQAEPPLCTACGSGTTRRILSGITVLGSAGGLTPGEQAAQGRQQAREATITPKDQIDKLRSKPTTT